MRIVFEKFILETEEDELFASEVGDLSDPALPLRAEGYIEAAGIYFLVDSSPMAWVAVVDSEEELVFRPEQKHRLLAYCALSADPSLPATILPLLGEVRIPEYFKALMSEFIAFSGLEEERASVFAND